MKKTKPKWVKTDIPKDIKIKLWRIMRNNPTYDAWSKDLAKRDFDENEEKFIPRSRDSYKALQDEIKQMPIAAVRELPFDIQVWIRELRPEIAELLKAGQEKYRDHWGKLARLAEELALCLEFRSDSIMRLGRLVLHGELVKSRTYPDKPGGCFFDGSCVLLSAERSPLYECLIEHLGAESPEFGEELQQAREIATRWFGSEREALWHSVADDELVSKLRKELYLCSERGTFPGKCPICKGWE